MYKLLIFLKKNNDSEIVNSFTDNTIRYLSDLNGTEVKAGEVESSLLLETKYIRFCEINFQSKEDWERKINSKVGKELNKHLMEFHQYIDIIFINYNN